MEYVTLGRTGRRVSRLGFGGATAGLKDYLRHFDPENPADADPIIAAIRRAYELGVNYYDTAAGYGAGASERIFGRGLDGIAPDSIFLATKVGPSGPDVIRRSLENSLTNLRRDWIDLLQLHGTVFSEEQMGYILRSGGLLDQLEQAREEGLIRHVGFTYEGQDRALYDLIDTGRFEVAQLQYNLLFQHPYDHRRGTGAMFELERRQMGIVTMRTTTSGIMQRWIQTVNPANTFDYTPAIIQFQLSNPLIDVALIGMRSIERVDANVALVNDTSGRMDLDEVHRHYV
ncbi:MAG: aldo/keto reductase [Anaerolineae bacterium]|jgi:aryl-alcohol dehydrogenase-like predicted oxidoreductase|nr:aldo/keto reductase [Chloroflexota bacterium]